MFLWTIVSERQRWHATVMHVYHMHLSELAKAVRGWGNSNASWPPSLYCLPVSIVDTLITCRRCSCFGPRQAERQADKTAVVDAQSRVWGSLSVSVTKWHHDCWRPGQSLHVTCQVTFLWACAWPWYVLLLLISP